MISMIHHYLEVHGKKELNFHADNCVGQNKNKTVLDACFGLLKKRYRSSDCDTMEHLKTTVELSSRSNVAQL